MNEVKNGDEVVVINKKTGEIEGKGEFFRYKEVVFLGSCIVIIEERLYRGNLMSFPESYPTEFYKMKRKEVQYG